MSKVIQTTTQDGVRHIQLSHPPVNAITKKMRAALIAALAQAGGDPAVTQVLISSKGNTFSAGTDIRDYRHPQGAPTLAHLCDVIEQMTKPVVVALHGTVLGAGLEIALAAHHRVAASDARFAFSEASLGLIPSGGATQRLPRLIGARAAFDLMVSGVPMQAQTAKERGLIDTLATGDLVGSAMDVARALGPSDLRRTRDQRQRFVPFDAFSAELKSIRSLADVLDGAPPEVLADLIEGAALLPFEAGIAAEADRFENLRTSHSSQAMRYVYTATRRAARSGVAKGTTAQPVAQVGVVGASSAGCRLAIRFLQKNIPVTLLDQDEATRTAGLGFIEKQLVKSGNANGFALLTPSSDLGDLAQADVVIETVKEDRALKEGLFRVLGARCKKDAVLATTTEAFDLAALAEMSGRPEDVIAIRISDRMPRSDLWEVTSHTRSADRAIATGCALARRVQMPLVRGFGARASLAQSLFYAAIRAGEHMVMRGADISAVDGALREFGFPLGVFQLIDIKGVSTLSHQLDEHGQSSALLHHLSEHGWGGVRSGRGFYDYGGNAPVPNVAAMEQAKVLGADEGLEPRVFSAPRIQLRIWTALLAEGARLVSTGAAKRPLDVDIAAICGLGFPHHRGGPMKAADIEGLLLMHKALRRYGTEDAVWAPDPLIAEALKTADGFDVFNGA
ncbi:enoyl-CoA hydratase-related protein [Nereida sp. MMG025]|uniref:enoyl-CoA hydratase-related protein n=1 Tax=Nereida sp. MMG025 TaxID=2909981 RepID=UPI001F007989|nr:enoyl-CoA hydratase-related protein [Nereida sp. MMG025]MCF6443703.1 enoyl-CoA hydratase-related protein [Nereida sp. MMG025]